MHKRISSHRDYDYIGEAINIKIFTKRIYKSIKESSLSFTVTILHDK